MGKGGKDKYKIKNWHWYNKSLCGRGRLALFITGDVIEDRGKIYPAKKVAGEKMYPGSVIECRRPVKNQFRPRLRRAQGFIESIFSPVPKPGETRAPDFSALCRRRGGPPVEISERLAKGENAAFRDRFNRVKGVRRGRTEGPQTWAVKTPDMDENEHMYRFGHPGNTCG